MKEKIKWLYCVKFAAILAVIIDHTSGVLYKNKNISRFSYYSVTLFILVSGYTSYLSNEKNSKVGKQKKVREKVLSILPAYILATFIFCIAYNKFFDFETFINHLVRFNATTAFYYVLLYLQLLLVSNILFNTLNRYCKKNKVLLKEILILVLLIFISYITMHYTNIFNVYGGGGKLLGGTYLIVYYLGMLFAKHHILDKITLKKSLIILSVSFPLWLVQYILCCQKGRILDKYIPFGKGLNPPSITLILYATTIFFLCYGLFTLLDKKKITEKINNLFQFIGKHTYYIFLYHILILYYLTYFKISISNKIINSILYVGCMIFIPILFEYIVKKIKPIIIDLNKYKKTDNL